MLKLYVWQPALSDYTDGAIIVLAHSLEEARELMLLEHGPTSREVEEMRAKPKVYQTPKGFAICGGA